MDEEEALLLLLLYKRSKPRKHRWWVHATISRRKTLGEFHRLVLELKLDSERFQQYFRTSTTEYEELLQKVAPLIVKKDTNYRDSIGVSERLAICLR